MNVPFMKAFTLIALVLALSLPLGAQWLNYPTKGVPRDKDGKPNLNAPAPKTADGHPDFSGIWDIEHNRPCPPEGCPDMRIGLEFIDIGSSLKGGLPFQPWAAALAKKRTDENGQEDPGSLCLPIGLVKLHTTPLMSKIVQVPGLLLLLNERETVFRQIFMDGRALPAIDIPSFNGYSSGKWEGDTLVVQTTGFKDGLWLDRNGSPLTDAAKITERFRRPTYGKLEIELTVDDPKAYTKPWTIKLNHFIKPDTELIDYMCRDNEKDIPHYVGK
jgi:hypothetical protein